MARRVIELDLPAVHDQVPVARRSLRIFARMEGLAPQEVDTLLLVASELLSNAVDHGGGDSKMDFSEIDAETHARMRLEFVLRGTRWELSVTDQGQGDVAELEELLDPEAMPDLEDERGRGFFLMRQMVDRVQVEPGRNGRGLRVSTVRDFGGA